jgi:DNA-binding LacI/PurR family transcriptional regulator
VLLAASHAAEAQQAGGAHRIGVLYPGADNSVFRRNFEGFRQGLASKASRRSSSPSRGPASLPWMP